MGRLVGYLDFRQWHALTWAFVTAWSVFAIYQNVPIPYDGTELLRSLSGEKLTSSIDGRFMRGWPLECWTYQFNTLKKHVPRVCNGNLLTLNFLICLLVISSIPIGTSQFKRFSLRALLILTTSIAFYIAIQRFFLYNHYSSYVLVAHGLFFSPIVLLCLPICTRWYVTRGPTEPCGCTSVADSARLAKPSNPATK